jgi:hypothetical protein
MLPTVKKLTAYEQEQACKLKALQRRIFRETIKARIAEPKKRAYKTPFMPTSSTPVDLQGDVHTAINKLQTSRTSRSASLDRHIIDAETGESLTFTTSTWNGIEGKVNLSSETILNRGTGKIDVLKADIPVPISSTSTDSNPLVAYFMENGPLNVRMHKDWDPKSGKVVKLPPVTQRLINCQTVTAEKILEFDDDDSGQSDISEEDSTAVTLLVNQERLMVDTATGNSYHNHHQQTMSPLSEARRDMKSPSHWSTALSSAPHHYLHAASRYPPIVMINEEYCKYISR